MRSGLAQAAPEDTSDLGAIYERHADAIYAAVYRCMGNAHDAEDVLHDVFLGLPEALREYQERGQFGAWLKRVAINTALMRMRAQRRLREEDIDTADLPRVVGADGLVNRIAAREAIERLPDSLRVVFMLKEVEGYTHDEIADMLSITRGASTARLFRAWDILLGAQRGKRA